MRSPLVEYVEQTRPRIDALIARQRSLSVFVRAGGSPNLRESKAVVHVAMAAASSGLPTGGGAPAAWRATPDLSTQIAAYLAHPSQGQP